MRAINMPAAASAVHSEASAHRVRSSSKSLLADPWNFWEPPGIPQTLKIDSQLLNPNPIKIHETRKFYKRARQCSSRQLLQLFRIVLYYRFTRLSPSRNTGGAKWVNRYFSTLFALDRTLGN